MFVLAYAAGNSPRGASVAERLLLDCCQRFEGRKKTDGLAMQRVFGPRQVAAETYGKKERAAHRSAPPLI
jgi:hypothetical protein